MAATASSPFFPSQPAPLASRPLLGWLRGIFVLGLLSCLGLVSGEALAVAIVQQPGSAASTVGSAAGFGVVATGTGNLSYQWRKNGTNIAGATGATYNVASVTTADAGSYTVVVRDAAGSVTSSSAELTVGTYVWSTFAGAMGVQGSANGNPGSLNGPTGLVLGADGSVNLADSGNGILRKITNAGNVSTFVGTAGVSGTADGVGAAAQFSQAQDVAVDSAGNLYVADTASHIIRKVSPDGQVTTLAGTALASGSTDGTGSDARFRNPWSLTVDIAGNLYVADGGNHSIRKITPAGVVTTFAGSLGVSGSTDAQGDAARFNSPYGVAADRFGNLYVADGDNHTIRKITQNGTVTTLAGTPGQKGGADGVGSAARFNFPSDLSVDAGGNVYVADYENSTVRKISPGGAVSTIGGAEGVVGATNGKGSVARFGGPSDVAVDSTGQLFVADRLNQVVRKGVFYTVPEVITQPGNQARAIGTQAQLKVVAKGTGPLNYQWRKSGVNIAGGTSDTLTLANLAEADGGSYDVVVSNEAGSVTSTAATLTALIPPAITVQPLSATVGSGASVGLRVTATGTALSYQWRKNGVAIPGATSASYGIAYGQVLQSGAYDVVVSNALSSVTSNVATLSVLESVRVVKSPEASRANPGAAVTLSVTVTGAVPITYQWRKGGATIAGATGPTYTIPSVSLASVGVYDVVVTNYVSTATSLPASITLNTPVKIEIQPTTRTVNPGAPASLSVVASGSAPISYQWRRNGIPVMGATASTFSVAALQAAQTGSYDVVVRNAAGSVTSNPVTLGLNTAPTITAQPVGGAVNPGGSRTLTVGASGTAPFTYQWRKGGVAIAGGTGSSYTIFPAQAASAGTYTVVVSNAVGSATSAAAVLSLNVPVTITTQPVGGVLVPGVSNTLSVVASGTMPLTYQWRKGGVVIPGATAASYTITSAQGTSAGAYDVMVSNVVGSVTSSPAVLEMASPVVINTQPAGGSAQLGGTYKFTVTASGSGPLSYIWRKDGVRLTGGSYSVVQGKFTWREAKADAEKRGGHLVTVVSAAEWEAIRVALGDNFNKLDLWMGATDEAVEGQWKWVTGEAFGYQLWSTGEPNGSGSYMHKWVRGGNKWDDIPNVFWEPVGYILETESGGPTYEITNAGTLSAGTYDVVVFNTSGGVISQTARLAVVEPLQIVANPFSLVLNDGAPASFSVIATGTGPLKYQWRKNGSDIAGATSESLRISSVQSGDAGSYDVVVTGASGSLTSTAASLAVNNLFITQQPVGGGAVQGGTFTFTVRATGTNPITYKWRKNGVPFGKSVYTYVDGKMNWLQAKADAESKGGHLATVSSAEEWAEISKQIGTNASKFSWLGGFQPTGSVEPRGGWSWVTGEPFTYTNWHTGEPNNVIRNNAPENALQVNWPGQRASSWNDLWVAPASSANVPVGYILETETSGPTLTLSNIQPSDAGSYDVVLCNPNGTVTSVSVNLSVQIPVVITQQPVGGPVNPGAAKTFAVEATGTQPMTFQWRRNGEPLAGGTGKTLVIPSIGLSDVGVYDVVVTNVVGGVRSQQASLSLNSPVTIVTQPRNMAVNPGQPFTLSVVAGGTAPFTYQWRKAGTPIAGATSSTLSFASAQAVNTGVYDVIVRNVVGSVTSSTATVTLNTPVLITGHPVEQAVNPGASASFSVTASGTAPFTYQWRRNGVILAGGTSSTLSLSNVQSVDAGIYDVVVTNIVGSQVSKGAALKLNVAPSIVTHPANVSVNQGAPFRLSVVATGTAPLTYQWRKDGSPVAGGTGAVYAVQASGTLSSGSYDVVVTNPVGNVTSNAASVVLNTPVTITTQPVSVTLNPGEPLSLSVVATGTGPLSYQWRLNGKAITGASAATFSLSAVSALNAGAYDVVVSNVVGSVISTTAHVRVNAPVRITVHPTSAAINPGAPRTLSVTATGTAPLSYQWRRNGEPIAGGTSAALAISTTAGEQAGNYDVVVSNVVGGVTSNTAVISLNVPVTIVTHPQSITGNVGRSVTLSVTAQGTASITYQWRKNGANILGATAATYSPVGGLTTANVGNYDVVLTNIVGSVTSNVATLALNVPVKIVTQPEGITVNMGDSATFAVVATGTAPLTYQWRRNGVNVSGANQASYTVSSAQVANAGAYSVVVTNPAGSVTSSTASLAVNPPANTKKYVYVSGNFTWIQAKAAAEARGGYLATVTSAEEWSAIVAQLGANSNLCLWLGGFQPPGSEEPTGGWQWVTGEPFVYTNWAAGEPNNQGDEGYLHVNWANDVRGTWNDMKLAGGGATRGYILEIDPIVLGTQPASLTVTEGNSATFTVAANGSAPITYQWRKNGVNIAGATSPTLSISSTAPGDAAGYDVLVQNAAGTITSVVATLSVVSPVRITQQPVSLVLNTGAEATFGVTATGTAPISYQWRFAGSPIAGATGSTFVIPVTQSSDAGKYDVVLTNIVGSVSSNEVGLAFNDPPTIVTHPQGAVLNPGGSVTLSVAVTGTAPYRYQWRFNGSFITGATSPTYALTRVTALSAGLYDVVITNIGGSITSNGAQVDVNVPVTITVPPLPLAVNPGAPASFSVTATGTPSLTYQWRRNGVAIPGANATTYSIAAAALADAGNYDVVVSNIVGSIASTSAALSLNTPLTITSQPVSGAANPNAGFTFRVAATGTTPIAYQWYRNGSPIEGATASVYAIAACSDADTGDYSVALSNVVGSVASSNATLRVNIPVSIVTQPEGLVLNPPTPPQINKGDIAPAPATTGTQGVLSVLATGTETLTYQWRKNGVPVAGGNGPNLTVSSTSPGPGVYDVVITNPVGSVTSNSVTVQLNVPLSIVSHPASLVVNPGTLATFAVTAAGTGPIGYQWKKDGVLLSDGTSDTYAIAAAQLSDVGRYEVVVTNVVGSMNSYPATLTLNTPLTFVRQPVALQVNAGGQAAFSAIVDGTAPITYQWRKDGVDIPGATSATYSLPAASTLDAGSYELVATNVVGSVTSSPALLSINEPVTITTQPAGLAVNPGVAATLMVVASGTAPLSYQWYRNGVAVSGGTAATLSIGAAQVSDAGEYKVSIANAVGTVTSGNAALSINEAVSFSTQPVGATVLTGTAAKLSVAVAGTAPFTYQWSRAGAPISGATAASFELPAAQESDSGTYSVEVTNIVGSAVSASAVLTVNTPLSITTQPAGLTLNAGSSATLAVTAAGTAPITYQWRKGGVNISGAVQPSLVLNPVADSDSGSYDVVLSNPAGSLTSDPAVLAINLPVSIHTHPASVTVVSGNTLSLSVSASGTGPISYQWRKDGSPVAGASSEKLEVTPVQASDAGSYDVVVTNVVGSVTSTAAAVSVLNPVIITSQPVSLTVVSGSLATFSVTVEGTGPISYQWFKDGAVLTGAVSDSFAISSALPQDEGSYTVVVSNSTGPVTSAAATLTVLEAPAITTQPTGSTVDSGQPITLSVVAVGGGTLSYQWSKNGSNIASGIAPTLTIDSAQLVDAGTYLVTVSNVAGSVTSNPAVVGVNKPAQMPVTIVAEPKRTAGTLNQPATLSVSAVGTEPISYQWYKNGVAVAGATSADYQIPAATAADQGFYWVKLSNTYVDERGQSASANLTSSKVLFAILGAPTVSKDPVSQKGVEVGSNVTFEATVRCDQGFSYLWYLDGKPFPANATEVAHDPFTPNADGVAEGVISLSVPAGVNTKGSYTLRVSNACGWDESAPAALDLIIRATRFLKQGWNYSFSNGELSSAQKEFSSTLVSGFPGTVASDDTLIVAYGNPSDYTYRWLDSFSTPYKSVGIASASLSMSSMSSFQKSKAGTYYPVVELTNKNTKATHKIRFQFKLGTQTPKVIVPPSFAFDLPDKCYAAEAAPFDFGVTLQTAESPGAFTYIWYKDGNERQRNNTGFFSLSAAEMSKDAGGFSYPAEGTYWVEIADAAGNVIKDASGNTVRSKQSTLYIFSD